MAAPACPRAFSSRCKAWASCWPRPPRPAAKLSQGTLRLIETTRPPPSLEYVIAYASGGLEAAGRLVAEMAKALIAQKPDLQAYYSAVDIDGDHFILSKEENFEEINKTA